MTLRGEQRVSTRPSGSRCSGGTIEPRQARALEEMSALLIPSTNSTNLSGLLLGRTGAGHGPRASESPAARSLIPGIQR